MTQGLRGLCGPWPARKRAPRSIREGQRLLEAAKVSELKARRHAQISWVQGPVLGSLCVAGVRVALGQTASPQAWYGRITGIYMHQM